MHALGREEKFIKTDPERTRMVWLVNKDVHWVTMTALHILQEPEENGAC